MEELLKMCGELLSLLLFGSLILGIFHMLLQIAGG